MNKREYAVNVKMNKHEIAMLDKISFEYFLTRSEALRMLVREKYKEFKPEA